jgi:hypothetical protein
VVAEYVMVLMIVVGLYFTMLRGLRSFGLAESLVQGVTGKFVLLYQYGQAPTRLDSSSGEALRPFNSGRFRIFINPM